MCDILQFVSVHALFVFVHEFSRVSLQCQSVHELVATNACRIDIIDIFLEIKNACAAVIRDTVAMNHTRRSG